jgi:threonine dehydratase
MSGVTVGDIQTAARALAGQAIVTPLLESARLNERVGGRLLIKAECLQKTGSFKFRGAFYRLSLLSADQRQRGVVAYSSGNHAQAVAAAAKLLGVTAAIVMPADAPPTKMAATRAWGAEVITYDRYGEDREAIGARLAQERGATLVPPYDDARIVAGQGTLGLEIALQAAALGARLDAALVPCGGGGLIAGTATALAARVPGISIYAVEPDAFNDTARSLAAGERLANPPLRADDASFCDALLAPMPGIVTFPINRRLLAGGLTVSDREVASAMAAAFAELKIVVEPGGAVALAAALTGKVDCAGKTVAVVCSGGNVEPAVFAAALNSAQARASSAE